MCIRDRSIAADIKHSIMKNLKSFENFSKDEIYDHRKAKFLQIGRDQGFKKSSERASSKATAFAAITCSSGPP